VGLPQIRHGRLLLTRLRPTEITESRLPAHTSNEIVRTISFYAGRISLYAGQISLYAGTYTAAVKDEHGSFQILLNEHSFSIMPVSLGV
jgi:hypothetical protein